MKICTTEAIWEIDYALHAGERLTGDFTRMHLQHSAIVWDNTSIERDCRSFIHFICDHCLSISQSRSSCVYKFSGLSASLSACVRCAQNSSFCIKYKKKQDRVMKWQKCYLFTDFPFLPHLFDCHQIRPRLSRPKIKWVACTETVVWRASTSQHFEIDFPSTSRPHATQSRSIWPLCPFQFHF